MELLKLGRTIGKRVSLHVSQLIIFISIPRNDLALTNSFLDNKNFMVSFDLKMWLQNKKIFFLHLVTFSA